MDRYLIAAKAHRDRTILVDGFQDPSKITYDIIVEALGLECRQYEEIRADIDSFRRSVLPDFSEERICIEQEVRKEFGFPAKEKLKELMHEDLIGRGLEGTSVGLERR